MPKKNPPKPITVGYRPGPQITDKGHPWTRAPGYHTISDGNHRFLAAQDLKMKRVPIRMDSSAIDYSKEGPMIKDKTGRDPYNYQGRNAMPKKNPPKTPAWKKASPNNPYNNAGPKIKASSTGPTRVRDSSLNNRQIFDTQGRTIGKRSLKADNIEKAMGREMKRMDAMGFGPNEPQTGPGASNRAANYWAKRMKGTANVDAAGAGMGRKNAQAKATSQYKRLISETPGQRNVRAGMQKKPVGYGLNERVDRVWQGLKNFSHTYGPKGTEATGNVSSSGFKAPKEPLDKITRQSPSGIGDYAKYNRTTGAMGGRGRLGKPKIDGGAMARGELSKLNRTAAKAVGVGGGAPTRLIGAGVNITTAAGIGAMLLDRYGQKKLDAAYEASGTEFKVNKDSGQAYKVKRKKK